MTELLESVFRFVYRCWLNANDEIRRERSEAQMEAFRKAHEKEHSL